MVEKTFRVGIIGFGFIGKVHACCYTAIPHVYQNPGAVAEITALMRTSKGRDLLELQSIGNPLVLTDLEEFAEQDLDLVDVCTPNVFHLEQIREILKKKKPHIYCEKPLGLNYNHAKKITQMAEVAGIFTHTAFMMRYYPAVRQAKAILESGALGEIYDFRAHFFHNSYMDPDRPTSWRLQKEKSGGGALTDLGIHIIDLARYLLGDVEWVQCHTRTFIKQRPSSQGSQQMVSVDVDDWGLCMVGMCSGAQGIIEATRMSGGAGDSTRVEIFGARGSIEIDLKQPLHASYYNHDRKLMLIGNLEFSTPQGERPSSKLWPSEKKSLGRFKDAHTACIYDFLLNIKEGNESALNFASALKAQEVLEAAYLSSAQDAQKITLPLI